MSISAGPVPAAWCGAVSCSADIPPHTNRVRIPRTALSRQAPTYARLLMGVADHWSALSLVGNTCFRCGATVEESALWPDEDYPRIPLLLEMAGIDKPGRGHRRSSHLYILWRYDGDGRWRELARVSSHGPEWVDYIRPIVQQEIASGGRRGNFHAAEALAARVFELVDADLPLRSRDEKRAALSLILEQLTARIVDTE